MKLLIYLIGGAPRAGKSTLAQQVSARLGIGWISTDVILEVIKVAEGEAERDWDASIESINSNSERFYPFFERFIWAVQSQTENYVVEGVDFLPVHVSRIMARWNVSAVFLGRSKMTIDEFDQYPGKSPGYANLPKELRKQIADDIPVWSNLLKTEADRFHFPYIDMSTNFIQSLEEAESVLLDL
jgi:hypothetical protein